MRRDQDGWRRDAAIVAMLLLIAAANGLLWLYSVPFHKAPDEGAHYQVVRFIRDNGRLPLFDPSELWLLRTPNGVIETYAAFPPLAYMVDAVAGWVTRDGSMWAARYMSFSSYLATVALTYWIGRRLFPMARSIALVAALVVAFLPQFVFTGGYVNNDALAAFEATAMLALLVSIWQSGARWPTLFGVGLMAGSMAVTKYTFYGVAGVGLVVAFLLLLSQERERQGWRKVAVGAAMLGLGTALMSGWWFIRNLQLYGEVVPGHVISAAKAGAGGNNLFIPVDHGINLLTLSTQTNFWELTLKSFVGTFGFMAVYLDAPYYLVALAFALIGLLGVLVHVVHRGLPRIQLLVGSVGLAMAAITIFSTMVVNVYGEYSPQGRYLFPVLVPFALGVSAGWYWLARALGPLRWTPALATLTLVGINLASLFLFVIPRNYGGHIERVTVQVDRPSEPHQSHDAIEIAGWSISEGMSDWHPYDPEIISDYRHPAPGIAIYVDGPPGEGRFLGQARYGFRRNDVAQFYGGASALERIGFWLQLPPGSLAPGKYQVYVCAPTPSGSTTPTCGQRDLEVL